MDAAFWDLIDRTRPEDGDPSAHAEALTEALVAEGAAGTVAFGEAFDRAKDALYRWDLWGAAYLALGGCSDDGFEYVRCWCIGQGQAIWSQAIDDPEGLFVGLLAGAPDPEERLEALGLHDGEDLLYVAGRAHERLTGTWRPPRPDAAPAEPAGAAWDEDDLPARFPRLAAALPDGWWGGADGPVLDQEGEGADVPPLLSEVLDAVVAGTEAFSEGHPARARELLEPILEDPARWAELAAAPGMHVTVAYTVGIARLQAGDVAGARAALDRVAAAADEAPHVRRALAQVALATGDLDAAGRWVDERDGAGTLDRALAATLAWRRAGDDPEAQAVASRRARAVLTTDPAATGHPWDHAGCLVLAGLVLVEAGDPAGTAGAVSAIVPLLADAPDDLPLLDQLRTLAAAALRLQDRPDDALGMLDGVLARVQAADRGVALRERARAHRAAGRPGEAATAYAEAVATFEAAGEAWAAGSTRREAAA